jgi:hypothetical protein
LKYFKIKKICGDAAALKWLQAGECIDKKYTRGRNKSRIAYRRNDSAVYIFFIYEIRQTG